MGFLVGLAIAIILYYFVSAILWLTLDSNILLWYKEHFGNPISNLRGQVVWITGASSGIGRALALVLAKQGVKLVLSARNIDQLNEVKAECLSGDLLAETDVLVLPMDILDLKSHEKCLKTILESFGRLDILVNNAGRSQRAAWEDIDVQVDRDLFELDVFATIHLSRIVVRYFIKEKSGQTGQIAATSSIAGLGPVPYSATYCAAKSALNAYLNCLRLEHPNIDVTIFAPGPVSTNFLKEAFTSVPNEKVGQSTDNQRRLTAERTGHLFAVSIANKMDLTWCARFPINFIAYCMQNYVLGKLLFKVMSGSAMKKLRDGKY